MSQFWHSHWAEDGFKPTRLQNWEVPRWHAEWPDRHCTTTRFDAHKNGRLFMSAKTSNSPWGNFKGTWELPLKIDRRTAEELSRCTEHKKDFWNAHKRKHERTCKGRCKELTATGNKNQRNRNDDDKKKVQSEQEIVNEIENKDVTEAEHSDDEFKEKCKVKEACVL